MSSRPCTMQKRPNHRLDPLQGAERQRRKKLKSAAVVGVTCCSAGLPVLDGQTFDVVMLDEASQLVEPLGLSPLTCARPRQGSSTVAVYRTSHTTVYTKLTSSTLLAHAEHQRFAPCAVGFCGEACKLCSCTEKCNVHRHKKPCCSPVNSTATVPVEMTIAQAMVCINKQTLTVASSAGL